MMNAHNLNSHSRIAHAQRLTEANEHRLAKIATNQPGATAKPHRSLKELLVSAIANGMRIARADT